MIAELQVEEEHLPVWYSSEYPCNIPLPINGLKELEGEVIAWGKSDKQRVPLVSVDREETTFQFNWEDWKVYILGEKYREVRKPFYARIPLHYHSVPGYIRTIGAKLMLSRRTPTLPKYDFPGFPIEQGFEVLQHLYESRCRNHVPTSKDSTRVILTHDIDTEDGFKWVKETAKLEMTYGFQSIFNVVGQGYRIDYEILDWLAENGFEIGLHGYNHDNKLIFLTESEIRRRIERCGPLLKRYGIKSFRSPSFLRNERLFNVLRDYFEYDYSVLDTDIICPGGNGGCLWTKKFTLRGLTHIPTTVPFEAPLYFHVRPENLIEFWKPKIEWLHACNGNVVVLTHPDPHYSGNKKMLNIYEDLLRLLNTKI
jgi:peptidoglycan/xylan/chitin deacetylase (PgdA/CDA1 family)